MRTDPTPLARLLRSAAGALLLAVAGWTPLSSPAAAQSPSSVGGQARVWFYRDYEPYESWNLARIDMNGSYVGAVENGSAFYRDVPAGHYHIAAESVGKDVNQEQDVDLAPGQQVYCKIELLSSWDNDGDLSSFQRDTFYVRVIPPALAQAEIARDRKGI